MSDAETLLKAWAELVGATYREFPATRNEAAFVLIRGRGIKVRATARREPEACNTAGQAADQLAQSLWLWHDAVESESPSGATR